MWKHSSTKGVGEYKVWHNITNRSTEQCTKAEDAIASELAEGSKDRGGRGEGMILGDRWVASASSRSDKDLYTTVLRTALTQEERTEIKNKITPLNHFDLNQPLPMCSWITADRV